MEKKYESFFKKIFKQNSKEINVVKKESELFRNNLNSIELNIKNDSGEMETIKPNFIESSSFNYKMDVKLYCPLKGYINSLLSFVKNSTIGNRLTISYHFDDTSPISKSTPFYIQIGDIVLRLGNDGNESYTHLKGTNQQHSYKNYLYFQFIIEDLNNIQEKINIINNIDWNEIDLKINEHINLVINKEEKEKIEKEKIEKLKIKFDGLVDDLKDYLIDLEDISKQVEVESQYSSHTLAYYIPDLETDSGDIVISDKYFEVVNCLKQFKKRWESPMPVKLSFKIEHHRFGGGVVKIFCQSEELQNYLRKVTPIRKAGFTYGDRRGGG